MQRGLVVICAGNNYDDVKLHDQHMAERLAKHAPTLYVDPPISHLSARKNPRIAPSLEGPRLRREPAGFWRLTPVVAPFPIRRGMRAVTQRLVRRALTRATRSIGIEVQAVVTAWPQIDVFGACGERLRVWWAQDDFAAGAGIMGLHAEHVAAGERARAAASDLVVAANPEIAQRWTGEGYDVVLIPYGCDPESFAGVDEALRTPDMHLPQPLAVLVGHLNERVEPPLLEAVADRGVSLLLVGPAADDAHWVRTLTTRPNVEWVGAQKYNALPGLLAHADVGLVPYTHSAFNRGSFPLKTLEYLSAGVPVVSTDLPATRWLGADEPGLVTIADGPDAYADAVVAALGQPMTAADRDRRRKFASAHSYDRRALDLLAALDGLESGRKNGARPRH